MSGIRASLCSCSKILLSVSKYHSIQILFRTDPLASKVNFCNMISRFFCEKFFSFVKKLNSIMPSSKHATGHVSWCTENSSLERILSLLQKRYIFSFGYVYFPDGQV